MKCLTSARTRVSCTPVLQRFTVLLAVFALSACGDTGIEEDRLDANSIATESKPAVAAANPTQTDTSISLPTDVTQVDNLAVVLTHSGLAASQVEEAEPGSTETDNTESSPQTAAGNENANTVFAPTPTEVFDGEILDDAIRITWGDISEAEGYNVYRQGQYLDTVFDTQFTDTSVTDGEYSYEIIAFDTDKNFSSVATGLTVSFNADNNENVDTAVSSENTETDLSTDTNTPSNNEVDTSEPSIAAAEEEVDSSTVTESQTGTDSGNESNTDTSTQTNTTTNAETGTATNAETNTATNEETSTEANTATSTGTNTDNTDFSPTDNESDTQQASTEESKESTNNASAETSFTSVTTPGFEGEVLDDSIRISWNADPQARGYNVYRQAQYYTTVFDTQFIDTDVYDDDYYYEIQAFDYDDKLYYIATGLTVSATTFGTTDPDAPQANENLLADYELVFSDEFTSSTLDTSKWNTSYLWGTDIIINNEEQYYVDINNDPDFGYNPFKFDGEHLTIQTIRTPAQLSSKARNQPYLSGVITSYDAFKFTYGYAETRAKMTHGRGYWPAFWLLNAYYVDLEPEIDIMEFIGSNQDVIYHTYHYYDENGQLRSTESFPVVGIDFTADFHTFGVEWMPGRLIFYVDGIATQTVIDPNVSSQEMYVLANQAVGGWWAGSPDNETPFPGEYIIDYIRVYQRITPYDTLQMDQSSSQIPLNVENPNSVLPNKRPSFSQWPEGYPGR